MAKRLDRFYIPTLYPNGLPDITPDMAYSQEDSIYSTSMAKKILDEVEKIVLLNQWNLLKKESQVPSPLATLYILAKEIDYNIIHDISGFVAELNINFNTNISLVIFSLEEDKKNRYFRSLFIKLLDKEGITVYGKK